MLILALTTDKLQVITSSAATVDVHASFVDHTTATDNVVAGKQNTAISSAATTDVVAFPATGDIRNIKTLTIRNRHATLATDITVQFDRSGTNYQLHKTTLLAGQVLEYEEGLGFFTIQASRLDRWMRLTGSDYVNATTSFTDITGLSCPVLNGKTYNFEAWLFHFANATTTGPRFGINGPSLSAITLTQLGPRVVTLGTVDATATLAYASDRVTAVDTSIGGATLTGQTQTSAQGMGGVFTAGADGTFILRGQSEVAVAAGLTVRQGSWLHVWEATG